MKAGFLLVLVISLSGFLGAVAAHAEGPSARPAFSPIDTLVYTTLVIVVIIMITILLRNRIGEKAKKASFLLISIPVVVSTIYLGTDTVYLNLVSESKGPVHWHADYEIWACGEKIRLAPPETWWDNKVGTPVLHHHDDDRMHIEGTLQRLHDADLYEFFNAIGGELGKEHLIVETADGLRTWQNGDECPDGPGTLQVFVYKTVLDTYMQEKLEDPEEYILSPHTNVPPGDCIIMEFDSQAKERTERICASYQIAIERGDIHGG